MLATIDPGHGGDDTGALHNGEVEPLAEKDLALGVSHRVSSILRQLGHSHTLTRSVDRSVSLEDRVDQVNDEDPDFFVSVHFNSYPESIQTSGYSLYHYPGSKDGIRLARSIHKRLRKRTPLDDRGVRPADDRRDHDNDPYLYVVANTTMPAVLVECAFISEQEDRKYATRINGMGSLAGCIADGLHERHQSLCRR